MSAGYDNQGMRRGGRSLLMRFVPILIGLAMIGWIAVKGCQRGPLGRMQIVGMNPQEEKALGLQAFEETLSDAKVVQGMQAEEVKAIAARLIAATKDPAFLQAAGLKPQDMDWQVEVVDSPEVNAFCLPGGKMVVYTGIIPIAKTEAGLATVLGHEISHALGRHGSERMASTQMAQIAVNSAGASISDLDPAQREGILRTLNAGAKYGILHYGRKHESEADHLGLFLMATAGFDPKESIEFWGRMQEATGNVKGQPEFMATHPSHETRIRDLSGWMPEAEKLYQARK
ncbi:M48 family metallopeptidase [Anatilimnocola sp. NA78]|uniref:M48 family metallopeptidase n=1 Tax=Anatilimnocola sp. NA78 TaxID=3415683 RepID=UPI003CE5ADF9